MVSEQALFYYKYINDNWFLVLILPAILIVEVVLRNLFDCSSSKQKELKRYLISFSKFTWSPTEEFLIGSDWESQSKARIIHYESKQKKTGYSESAPPHPGSLEKRSSCHQFLCCMNFSVLLDMLDSMRVTRPKFVTVFPVQFILNICLLS